LPLRKKRSHTPVENPTRSLTRMLSSDQQYAVQGSAMNRCREETIFRSIAYNASHVRSFSYAFYEVRVRRCCERRTLEMDYQKEGHIQASFSWRSLSFEHG